MTRSRVNHLSFIIPLLFSGLALALVLANIVAAVPPQPDENASAHIFQLLIAAQLPLIALFVATADWRSWSPVRLLAVQAAAIALACLPVWLAGY